MTMQAHDGVTIRTTLQSGDIGAIVSMHGVYAREHAWDHHFEAYVAGPLSEFALRGDVRECIWVVEQQARVLGSIAIARASQTQAQLRWFMLDPQLRGRGLGRRLVRAALDFAHGQGYAAVMLWTVAGLDAARALYQDAGFVLTDEQARPRWGAEVIEQRFDLSLRG